MCEVLHVGAYLVPKNERDMSKTVNITKRFVESLAPSNKDQTYWDSAIKGFGVKITPKGKRAYLFKYRNLAKTQRRSTLGYHGTMTCEQARKMAIEWAYEVSLGKDPAAKKQIQKESPTVSELCDRYMTQHSELHKKPNSIRVERLQIENQIKPKLGKLRVLSVTQNDIASLHHQLRDTPVQANRVRSTLSKMFNLAEKWGLRPNNSNPVQNIDKYPEKPRERFLSEEEVERLFHVLQEEEKFGIESIHAIYLFRLLLLTGARVSEIRDAKWEWVNFEKKHIRLPDSKTGRRNIQLSPLALETLSNIPHIEGNPYIICGKSAGKPLVNARKPWLRIRKKAEIDDVTLHDLRHSYAAASVRAEIPMYYIQKLLGHKQLRTTERYAHLAENPIQEAADLVGKQLEKLNG